MNCERIDYIERMHSQHRIYGYSLFQLSSFIYICKDIHVAHKIFTEYEANN